MEVVPHGLSNPELNSNLQPPNQKYNTIASKQLRLPKNQVEKENVKFNELEPLRPLNRGLGLSSHPKDRAINSENKLHEFVSYCLCHRYDSCTKG